MNLSQIAPGAVATVTAVGGEGSFRRRLMELGILPGTRVEFVGVAPLGDPLEFLVRGSSLSIRRAEALDIEVSLRRESERAEARKVESAGALHGEKRAELCASECARGAP